MAATAVAVPTTTTTTPPTNPTVPVNNPSVTGVAIVVGEVHPIVIADLAPNTAVQYYMENPKSKPRWCLRKTPHDVSTCTFLHRKPEKASNFVMVRGEPAPVSIGHLIQNKGLERLLGSVEVFGEWCDLASPHDITNCKRLHLGTVTNDRTVNVEGEEAPVAVSHLLLNRGASYLLTFPEAKGVWCNNKIVHDVVNCPYVHRRIDGHPKIVNVEDEKFPVPVSQLIPNKALNFLLDNPQCSGRWCGRLSKHDVEDCSYLHRVHPFVRVDGESVRINTLRSNRGLKYLLEHPSAQGHWCRSATHDEEHPMETCTFIHLRDETRQQSVAERAAAAAATLRQSPNNMGPAVPHHGTVPQLHNNYHHGPARRGGAGGRGGGYANHPNTHAHSQEEHQHQHAPIGERGGRGGRGASGAAPFATNTTRGGYNNTNGGNYYPQHVPHAVDFVAPNQPQPQYNGHNNNNNNFHSVGPIERPAHQQQQTGGAPRREPLPVRPVAGVVRVAGQPADATTLINNPGLQFLLNYPAADGRYCTRISDPNHRSDICHYIHRR